MLEPAHFRTFLEVRLWYELPLALVIFLLWTRLGARRPELLTFLLLVVMQTEIAWIVVRATDATDVYLLAICLPVFGSGVMMGGRPRWTLAVAAWTWLAFCLAFLSAAAPMSSSHLVGVVFFVATSSIISYVGHAQRYRVAVSELAVRSQLEVEQARTNQLLVQLERMSHEDALTGLANRRRWDAEIATVCARSRQVGCGVAVLIVDIDRFKDVNDRYGHGGGDEALRAVGDLLACHVRDGDLVARIGGDEFGVLLIGADAVRAAELAEELRAAAAGLRTVSRVEISLSLGVAAAHGEGLYAEMLMAQADEQLYRAKTTRNAVAAAHLSLVVADTA
ncbi:MAG: diguanylate cyclase [Mycobacteriales bacterium]